ncbi:MAG TPA: hypothetical protein DCK95_11915 [Anaerolineaceae bacterium]|nr:hypothetical protein [Anaerolineaceae bacterium]
MKSNYLVTSLLVLITALIFSSCTTQDMNRNDDMDIELTGKDNGTSVSLKNGATITIRLEGNITTGYAWDIKEIDENFFKQIGDIEYVKKESMDSNTDENSPVGASGEFVFTFSAIQSGETTLQLQYHRSFEEGVEPLEVFTVSFVISD